MMAHTTPTPIRSIQCNLSSSFYTYHILSLSCNGCTLHHTILYITLHYIVSYMTLYIYPISNYILNLKTEFSEADVSLFLRSDESTMLKTLQNKLKVNKKAALSSHYNFMVPKVKKKVLFIFYRYVISFRFLLHI